MIRLLVQRRRIHLNGAPSFWGASHPQRAVQALSAIRDDASRPAAQRIESILALKLIEIEPSVEQLVALASADDDAAEKLILNFDSLFPNDVEIDPSPRQLIVGSIDHPNAYIGAAAADIAADRQYKEAAATVVARVMGNPVSERRFLRAAAVLSPTREILDVARQLLADARLFEGTTLLVAISEIVKHAEDETVRRDAAAVCAERLRQHPGDIIDSGIMAAVDAIASLPPEEARPIWMDLSASASSGFVTEQAASHLAPPQSPASPTTQTLKSSRQPETALTNAANICVQHRLLTREEADQALKKRREYGGAGADDSSDIVPDDTDATSLFYWSDRLSWFDVETGMVPNRHDLLVENLSKNSAGKFTPEATTETYVTESPDADVGIYGVQFIHGTKLYRFSPRDLGDWYDVVSVLVAVDRALADAGIEERFVPLDSGGQDAILIFAHPDALRAASAELGLTLSDDPDQARKGGKAFEEKMIQQLGSEREIEIPR